jgi:hypothetical protein
MRRRLVVAMTLVCLAGLLRSNSARAAAGALDPAFGSSGKVLTRFSNCGLSICNAQPANAVLQADAKIVVAVNFLGFKFGAVRYTSNGALDQTFGNHGLATVAFANNDLTTVYAEASDGKIIVAGNVQKSHFGFFRAYPPRDQWKLGYQLRHWGTRDYSARVSRRWPGCPDSVRR